MSDKSLVIAFLDISDQYTNCILFDFFFHKIVAQVTILDARISLLTTFLTINTQLYFLNLFSK